ncbi:MAG: hypothetical protein ACC700_13160 [Anaerolineales bacterium]
MILKSLVHVFDADGYTAYRRTGGVSFVYKYLSVVRAPHGRSFMTNRETLTGGEISRTVLYPSYKNKVDILTGLTMSSLIACETSCARSRSGVGGTSSATKP